MINPIPTGYNTITCFITCEDAQKEMKFLEAALGAQPRMSMPCPETGRLMHAEMQLGTSVLMLSDKNPAMEFRSVKELGGSPAAFYLYVKDVDAAFAKATKAGGKVKMPVSDMFWGDRMGSFECPEGYSWSLATHMKDLTPEEMKAGQKKWLESMKAGASK